MAHNFRRRPTMFDVVQVRGGKDRTLLSVASKNRLSASELAGLESSLDAYEAFGGDLRQVLAVQVL